MPGVYQLPYNSTSYNWSCSSWLKRRRSVFPFSTDHSRPRTGTPAFSPLCVFKCVLGAFAKSHWLHFPFPQITLAQKNRWTSSPSSYSYSVWCRSITNSGHHSNTLVTIYSMWSAIWIITGIWFELLIQKYFSTSGLSQGRPGRADTSALPKGSKRGGLVGFAIVHKSFNLWFVKHLWRQMSNYVKSSALISGHRVSSYQWEAFRGSWRRSLTFLNHCPGLKETR